MQSFLLSLAKASKQKGLAYIKLIAGVCACDSKKNVTAHSMPAKFNSFTEITVSKTVTGNAYRFKYVLIWK